MHKLSIGDRNNEQLQCYYTRDTNIWGEPGRGDKAGLWFYFNDSIEQSTHFQGGKWYFQAVIVNQKNEIIEYIDAENYASGSMSYKSNIIVIDWDKKKNPFKSNFKSNFKTEFKTTEQIYLPSRNNFIGNINLLKNKKGTLQNLSININVKNIQKNTKNTVFYLTTSDNKTLKTFIIPSLKIGDNYNNTVELLDLNLQLNNTNIILATSSLLQHYDNIPFNFLTISYDII